MCLHPNFVFSSQAHFFDEYAMEGVSAEFNEIFLEFCPENLLRAMKTAQNAKYVKIKLTKKHSPCLTVEVDLVIIMIEFLYIIIRAFLAHSSSCQLV